MYINGTFNNASISIHALLFGIVILGRVGACYQCFLFYGLS